MALNSSIAVFKVLMPFYLGELGRVAYLERHCGLTRKASFSVSFIYLGLGFLGRLFWAVGAGSIFGWGKLRGGLLGLLSFQGNVPQWFERTGLPLRSLRVPLVLSVLSCVLQVAAFYAVSLSFHLALPLDRIIWLYPLIDILAKAPIFYRGFGAREGMMIAAFSPYAPSELIFTSTFTSSFLIEFITPAAGIFFVPWFLRLRAISAQDQLTGAKCGQEGGGHAVRG